MMINKKTVQENVVLFHHGIEHVEKILEENHWLDIPVDLTDTIMHYVLPALQDPTGVSRNCVLVDVLDHHRSSYKLLKTLFQSDHHLINDIVAQNVLVLYIIVSIRTEPFQTTYDVLAQEGYDRFPDNDSLQYLSFLSQYDEMDEIVPLLYEQSQYARKLYEIVPKIFT